MTKIITKEKTGNFIRKFDKTPNTIYCPHFYILGFGSNACRFKCSWCFLQGTYRDLIPNPVMYTNNEKMLSDIAKWIETTPELSVLNCGELGDPIDMMDSKVIGEILDLFNSAKRKVKLLFVTKSDNYSKLMECQPSSNVAISFSINSRPVSKKWEILAPSPIKRIEAAKRLRDHGFNIRFRIDPIVPVANWGVHYAKLIDTIFKNLTPERITLGTLRHFPAVKAWAKKHKRNLEWVEFAKHRCNESDKRYRMEEAKRIEAYDVILEQIGGRCRVGICKEEKALLDKLVRLELNQCNCLY